MTFSIHVNYIYVVMYSIFCVEYNIVVLDNIILLICIVRRFVCLVVYTKNSNGLIII